MAAVLVDDDARTVAYICGGAGARTTETATGRRVVIDDPVDMWGPWASASAPLYADNVLLTATFNNTLARVDLLGSGLEVFTQVTLQRSLDLVTWTTVRGATSLAVAVDGTVAIPDYEFTDGVTNFYRLITLAPFGQTSNTASVVPALGDVWLKSIARPFLNMRVTIVQPPQFTIARTARTGVYPIKGRTFPTAVNDLRLARRWTLNVRTETAADTEALTLLLASGDVLFLQVPVAAAKAIPGGYITIGDAVRENHPLRALRVTWDLPCTEVAEPSPYVRPVSATWASLVAQYGTWADVVAAFSSWSDLLDTLTGDASEVIVS